MTAEIWYGRKPETKAEQNALLHLYHYLHSQPEHFLILIQFHTDTSNEMDWVVIKENGMFVVELKDVGNANRWIFGRPEGQWKVIDPIGDQERDMFSNPFKQVKYHYWHFCDWCDQNREKILIGDPVRVSRINFKKAVRSCVVITPDLNPASDIQIANIVDVVGLPKFMTMLLVSGSSYFNLSLEEMQRIPQLLALEKWELAPPAGEPEDKTHKLQEGWEAEPFTGLIALGHNISLPMLNFDLLNKADITVGRDSGNDLAIENETVSRQHAHIYLQDSWYVVEDLGSTSGTYVNFKGESGVTETHLGKGMGNRLRNHSIVRFGEVRFIFLLKQ